MIQVAEFRGKEIAFLNHNKEKPLRGYQIINSQNYEELQKILQLQNQQYNTYVTIATYSQIPRFPLNPKQHWPEFKEWVKIRDETITKIDFMLDFDAEPTIQGLTKAWQDVQTAQKLLPLILGEQTKYLTIYFSGNKGFHILGKTKVTTTAQDNIKNMLNTAEKLKPLCPTLDLSIYDTARLRKLLGSYVYSANFGKTRVIPILNNEDFKALINALETKNTSWFESKQLIRLNNINITEVDKQ